MPQNYSSVATRTASTLSEIRSSWDPADEIQADKEGGYTTYQQKPSGNITDRVAHVLVRTSEDRKAHRDAIELMAQEIGTHQGVEASKLFQDRFALRKLLGQPVTVDAFNQFCEDVQEDCLPKGTFNTKLAGAAIDLDRTITHSFSKRPKGLGSFFSKNPNKKTLTAASFPPAQSADRGSHTESPLTVPSSSSDTSQQQPKTTDPLSRSKPKSYGSLDG